jgi:integrase
MFVDFLNRYRAKSTRALYVSAWVKFLSLAYGARLAGASPEVLDPWVGKYVNDLRNGRRDLAADLRTLEESVRSPKTGQAYQSAIRTLLAGREGSSEPDLERRSRDADLPLPPEDRRQPAGAGRVSPPPGEGALTTGMILRLLEHLDTRGRAILYVLVSSGAQVKEVLSLRLGDLDLESRPARFRVRDPDGGVSRVAFISREAVGAIRVYLIVRDRFLASARSRGSAGDADLLFPLGPRALEGIWALALAKARLARPDPVTGRRTITPRAARRFFAGQMGKVLPAPVVEELMGRPGRLPGRGRRYTDEELAGAYLEGEPAVTLHRSHGKEKMARRVAELERLVRILGEEARERDRELGRIKAILKERETGEQARGP